MAHRVAGDTVTGAAHGDGQLSFPRKPQCCHDVARIRAARDQRRSPIDCPVPYPTRFRIGLITRSD